MSFAIYLGIAIGILAVLSLLFHFVVQPYRRYRETRVITCPETQRPAAVKLNAAHAAFTAAVGHPDLRLEDCTRWPERQDCGQECLSEIREAPEACLVRNMLIQWYQGKSCVYCGQALGQIDWMEHRPALMSPERRTVQWREVRPETLPDVLATYLPVCWNCHIAESFRREHPELVTDRNFRR